MQIILASNLLFFLVNSLFWLADHSSRSQQDWIIARYFKCLSSCDTKHMKQQFSDWPVDLHATSSMDNLGSQQKNNLASKAIAEVIGAKDIKESTLLLVTLTRITLDNNAEGFEPPMKKYSHPNSFLYPSLHKKHFI